MNSNHKREPVMKLEQIVKQLVDLDYWYEHLPANGLTKDPHNFVYFRAEEILPILEKLEKGAKSNDNSI